MLKVRVVLWGKQRATSKEFILVVALDSPGILSMTLGFEGFKIRDLGELHKESDGLLEGTLLSLLCCFVWLSRFNRSDWLVWAAFVFNGVSVIIIRRRHIIIKVLFLTISLFIVINDFISLALIFIYLRELVNAAVLLTLNDFLPFLFTIIIGNSFGKEIDCFFSDCV